MCKPLRRFISPQMFATPPLMGSKEDTETLEPDEDN